MLVTDFLTQSAQSHPNKPAVWYKDAWMAYSALDRQSNQLANALLDADVRRGDRVAILCENSFTYIISYFGILKAGALAVPLNTDITAELLTYYLNHSGSKILIASPRFSDFIVSAAKGAPQLDQVILDGQGLPQSASQLDCKVLELKDIYDKALAKKPDVRRIDLDLAMIVYTSGSTGDPKGVMLSHLNIVSNTKSVIEYLHLTAEDRIMVTLPFYYIYGQSLLLTHFAIGGSVVIENNFLYPEVTVRAIKQMGATGFAGVPSTFIRLLKRSSIKEASLDKLRYVTQAGGHMAPLIRREVSEAIAPAQLYVMYGATEAAPRLTYLEPGKLDAKLSSIGKAIPNVDVLVVDNQGHPVMPSVTGEIVARGSNIMVGYWNDEEATKEAFRHGYYHTGDLGQIDDDGYIYVVGRLKDMIKSDGYRVSAKEVEDAIMEIDGIAEVAVIGVEDEIMGEAIKAFLMLDNGDKMTLKALRKELKGRLPDYKMPRDVEVMDHLPTNESGKIMKTELRKQGKPTHG